jgi:hypothetical protein
MLGTALLLGALALAGCSTAQDLVGIERAGYQNDGTYVLTNQEENLGCRQLQERSQSLQEQMQALPGQAMEQMQALPNTVSRAWKRLVGAPGDGVPAIEQYNEVKAESIALNQTAARKGCPPLTTASIKR